MPKLRFLLAALFFVPLSPAWCQTKAHGSSVQTAADFYALENLLKIELTMEPAVWDQVRQEKRVRTDGKRSDFTYRKGDIRINGTLIRSVGIRKKGFVGSLSTQRPSLKIKLREFVKGQSFAGIKRLTLNNNQQDESLVRQYLSYKWFRRAGIAAPRCNLAQVWINGKYLGIYSNVEPVKTPLLRDQLGSAGGTLYESTAADFSNRDLRGFETKTNKSGDTRAELKALIAILDSNSADRATRLAELVDIEKFLTFWSAEVMLGHWDGYAGNRNNFFVYWHPKTSRFVFLPWGTDGSFSTSNPFIGAPAPRLIKAKGRLCSAVFADAGFRQRYFTIARKLLDEWWQEKELLAEVDRATQLVRDHIHLRAEDFDAAIDKLKAYIRELTPQLEKELASPPKAWVLPIYTKPEDQGARVAAAKSTLKGSFEIPYGSYSPTAPEPLENSSLNLIWRGEKVPLTTMLGSAGFKAKKPLWYEAPHALLIGTRAEDQTPIFVALKLDPEILTTTHDFKLDMFDVQAWFGKGVDTGGVAILGRLTGTLRCEVVEVDGKRLLKGVIDAVIRSRAEKL